MSSRGRPVSANSKIPTLTASLRGDSSGLFIAQNAALDDSSAKYIHDLEEKIGKMESAMLELTHGLTSIKSGIPTLKDSLEVNKGLQPFAKEIEDIKKQNAEQLAAAETERKKLEKVNDKLQVEATELRHQLKIQDGELQQTKTRLSQLMGNKLVNNNPAIADLSDPYRPTKLAEKFNELYDNDWTDAFEEIQWLKHYDEVKCVETLLQILIKSERFCTQKWQEYVEGCKDSLQKGKATEIPDIVAKQLKDIAKSFAPNLVDDVYKDFTEQSKHSNAAWLFHSEKLQSYLKGCIELCWLMVAQDPPVVFKTEFRKMEIIDKNILKKYTRSGDKIEYLVWPPLLLHEGGPALAKGVAQAVEDIRRPQSAPSGGRQDHSPRSGGTRQARTQVGKPMTAWGDTLPSQSPEPMSVDSPTTHHARHGNYQQLNVRTGDWDQRYSSGRHQQQPTGHKQTTDGSSSDGHHIMMGGQTNDPYPQVHYYSRQEQQSQQELTQPVGWNHPRIPTQAEMEEFTDYVSKYNYPEERIRRRLGNERFDMCRDYYNHQ